MELHTITENEFIQFKYHIYRDDPYFSDSSFFNLRAIFRKTCNFTKKMNYTALAVLDHDKILCEALLLDVCNSALYLAYFDAEENVPHAVKLLTDYALKTAQTKQKRKLIIGVNGHVSYGIGFLTGSVTKPVSFDSLYQKPYYAQYFSHFKKTTLQTYEVAPDQLTRTFSAQPKCSSLTVRAINMKRFDAEMRDFTALCNETLYSTRYYEPVEPEHMGQLIGGLKPFLKSENILFCERNGEKIGFLFWHPDYNDLFNKGRKTSVLRVALRFLLFKKLIKSVKINAVGVKKCAGSEYALYLLMRKMYKTISRTTHTIETTYVLDSNPASKNTLLRSGFSKQNEYCVFEADVL